MIPTFVFVHGSNSNSFTWAPLQRELALLGHRALAVDLPGHGFDAAFPACYQAPQDLAALAAEHGPVILVGHSRGGLTLTQGAAQSRFPR